jgi:HlyD family secretion protein
MKSAIHPFSATSRALHAVGRPLRWTLCLSAVAGLSVLGIVLSGANPFNLSAIAEGSAVSPGPVPEGTAPVTRGPLSYVITGGGSLDCTKKTVLTSKVEWRTKLTKIVPEGTFVKAGDVVAELDVSNLTEEYGEERVDVLMAETTLGTAQQDLQLQELVNRNTLASAKLARELAEMALESYVKAEYAQQVGDLERQIAEANDALHLAQEQVRFTARLVHKDLKTPTELTEDRLTLMQAEQKHSDLIESLRVLREHTYPRTVAELQGLASTAETELEKQTALAKTLLIGKQMQVDVATRRLMRQQQQFDWASRMLKECQIKAPHDGQVIYVQQRSNWSDEISPGVEVRFRQPLVVIPDRSKTEIAIRVHESLRRHLIEGLPAVVRLTSDPKQPIPAHVTSVSAFPLSGRWPNRDRREYEVVVALDAEHPELIPGLSADVDLIAAARDDAIQVPIEAVTEIDGQYVAFVKNGATTEGREVTLGASSNDQIEILRGLDVGDRVVLTPREHCPTELLAWQKTHSEQDETELTAFAD